MKKSLLLVAFTCSLLSATAGPLGELGIFNHLGVNASVGTTGIGIEASTPITNWVQMRAGVSILPDFSFSTDADVDYTVSGIPQYTSADLDAGFGRTQGQVIFNIYPIPKAAFFVAVGAYFSGNKLVKIKGQSDALMGLEDPKVQIGDYYIPVDTSDGSISGSLKVNGFRPYVGIGWGRVIPGKRINFNVELGVQFHGTPKVYDMNDTQVELETEYSTADDDFQKIMDKLTVWPVLSFRLCGKIF